MKQECKKSTVYIRFAVTTLVCAALLFIALGVSGHAMMSGPTAILLMVHTVV